MQPNNYVVIVWPWNCDLYELYMPIQCVCMLPYALGAHICTRHVAHTIYVCMNPYVLATCVCIRPIVPVAHV
jgi:hypothetical protein